MKLHKAEVVGRERHGDHTLLSYRWPGEPPLPGQFVVARPASSALDPFLPRPFFAHDFSWEDGVASLLFKVLGRGTALLAEDGAGILVSAPTGRGFELDGDGPIDGPVGGPVALLGGGVWVAPLKLLARHLERRGAPHDVYLEVPKDAPEGYRNLLSRNHPEARRVTTDDPAGAPERLLSDVGDLGRYAAVFVSGPRETLAAAREACVGVVPAQIALRERMACANGSCYGCAVPVRRGGERTYERACVEGPVFPAEVLAW